MNTVSLVGRRATKPETRFTADNKAYSKFTLAVQRPGREAGTDFIRCTAFGKTAEVIDQFVKIGNQLAVTGHIQTGSYENKDGVKVYTTDVIIDSFTFISSKQKEDEPETKPSAIPGFEEVVDDLPF